MFELIYLQQILCFKKVHANKEKWITTICWSNKNTEEEED